MLNALLEHWREHTWQPVERGGCYAGCAAILALILWEASSEERWLFLIDNANLAFHEFGHLLFRPFGDTASLYGGTLGQLLMPLIVAGAFWRQSQPVSFAIALAWCFQNFHNIARYMADARAQALPLVGGGDHDWFNIFWRWNVIEHDTGIARFTAAIGWLGMLACAAWLFWRHLQDQE
jgi:hypothetical protein